MSILIDEHLLSYLFNTIPEEKRFDIINSPQMRSMQSPELVRVLSSSSPEASKCFYKTSFEALKRQEVGVDAAYAYLRFNSVNLEELNFLIEHYWNLFSESQRDSLLREDSIKNSVIYKGLLSGEKFLNSKSYVTYTVYDFIKLFKQKKFEGFQSDLKLFKTLIGLYGFTDPPELDEVLNWFDLKQSDTVIFSTFLKEVNKKEYAASNDIFWNHINKVFKNKAFKNVLENYIKDKTTDSRYDLIKMSFTEWLKRANLIEILNVYSSVEIKQCLEILEKSIGFVFNETEKMLMMIK